MKPDRLEITLLEWEGVVTERVLEIPWSKPSFRRRRQILAADPAYESPRVARAISSEQQQRLVEAIAEARRWLDEIVKTGIDASTIASRVGRSERSVRMGLSLAFLAPRYRPGDSGSDPAADDRAYPPCGAADALGRPEARAGAAGCLNSTISGMSRRVPSGASVSLAVGAAVHPTFEPASILLLAEARETTFCGPRLWWRNRGKVALRRPLRL